MNNFKVINKMKEGKAKSIFKHILLISVLLLMMVQVYGTSHPIPGSPEDREPIFGGLGSCKPLTKDQIAAKKVFDQTDVEMTAAQKESYATTHRSLLLREPKAYNGYFDLAKKPDQTGIHKTDDVDLKILVYKQLSKDFPGYQKSGAIFYDAFEDKIIFVEGEGILKAYETTIIPPDIWNKQPWVKNS